MAACAISVQVAVQTLAGQLPLALWPAGMSAAAACMYGFIIVATRVSARDAGYFAARALVLAELVAALHWQMHCFFFLPGGQAPAAAWQASFLVMAYGLGFTVAYCIESRHFKPSQPLEATGREIASAVAIALVTFFMSNISFTNAHTPFSGRLGLETFYIRTLVDLCGFVALYAQQGHRLQQRAQAEVAAIDGMLRLQHEQYLQSKRSMELVARKYHDLKHQIEVIRSEADPGRRASYLDELKASVQGYAQQISTGNRVLDVILTTKNQECRERQIDFTCVVDGQALDFMSAMDVSAVFGNALDNALHAASTLEPERRLIKLAAYTREQLVMVTCENVFSGELRTELGEIVTRREDRERHGYGLKSIRHTAEKYGGSVTVNSGDEWFKLRILLPVPVNSRVGSSRNPPAPARSLAL